MTDRMSAIPHWTAYAAAALGLVLLLAAGPLAYRAGRRRERRRAALATTPPKKKAATSRGDLIAAAIATAVSAEGMWTTFEALKVPVWLRLVTFAFIEVNVVQCARRARRTMQRKLAEIAAGTSWGKASSGIDGIAMWVLTCLSALLSAAHEVTSDEPGHDPNAAVILVRLVAPLIAAWGWERHMALERHASGLRKAINWTLTLERIALRLGIAEPAERTVTEVDTVRRLHRVAVAAARIEEVSAGGWRTKGAKRRAAARFRTRMREALEHTGLADDAELQARLDAETAALTMAGTFSGMARRPFWMPPPLESDPRPKVCCGKHGAPGTVAVRVRVPGEGLRPVRLEPAERRSETSISLMARVRERRDARRALRAVQPPAPAPAPALTVPITAPARNGARKAPPLLPQGALMPLPVRPLDLLNTPQSAAPAPAVAEDPALRTPATARNPQPAGPQPAGPQRPAPTRPAPRDRSRPAPAADGTKTKADWIAEIADEIHATGDGWEPDYTALQARTRKSRRSCEAYVAAARKLAATADADAGPPPATPQPAHAGARN